MPWSRVYQSVKQMLAFQGTRPIPFYYKKRSIAFQQINWIEFSILTEINLSTIIQSLTNYFREKFHRFLLPDITQNGEGGINLIRAITERWTSVSCVLNGTDFWDCWAIVTQTLRTEKLRLGITVMCKHIPRTWMWWNFMNMYKK